MQIWVDVTTILRWQRSAVGIVRVEAEYAAYLLRAAPGNVRFCSFHRFRGFSPVGPDQVSAAVDRVCGAQRPAGAPGKRFGTLLADLSRRLPPAVRETLLDFARSQGELLTALLIDWQHIKPPFAERDVYVSLGLDWDDKNKTYLRRVKRRLGLKVLGICYDIIPVKLPHLYGMGAALRLKRYLFAFARSADRILCISQTSKEDLRQLLAQHGLCAPPMSVIRLGCEPQNAAPDSVADDVADVLRQPFILFVSTIERRKGHETVYRAYLQLIEEGDVGLPLLVFVGMTGWGVSDLLAALRADTRTRHFIRILSFVSDADLARLYRQCLFTVYPSVYEGWGLPVAESLAAGKFCLASTASAIREVGGGLLEYIEPHDVRAWAQRLRWYCRHPEQVQSREARIRSEYRPTSWHDTSRSIFEAASELAAQQG